MQLGESIFPPEKESVRNTTLLRAPSLADLGKWERRASKSSFFYIFGTAKWITISSGPNKKVFKTPPFVTYQKSYPPSSEYLCAKDRTSEARPLPSQTTTGTGGSSRRYSRTMEITFGPPSTTRPTTGTPCPSPATHTTSTFRPRSRPYSSVTDQGSWPSPINRN